MSSPQPTPDGTPAEHLHRRLEADRQKLLHSGIYLGEADHSFLEDATWKRLGRGYQLMTNASVETTTTENTDTKEPGDDDPNSSVEQAIFSVVVQIDYDDCWLTPCRHWKGPTQFTKEFEDIKLTFQGERPNHEVFSQDFTAAINNIRELINTQITAVGSAPNAVLRGFLSHSRANNADVLKFRHVVFEKVDGYDSDTASETEDVYTLAGWPIIHPEAENARQEMMRGKAHQVVPLPAYDIKGNLIRPDKYKEALAGALVRVSFTMAHWYITSGSELANSFVADVKAIRVLTDPTPKSPRKRRTAKQETELPSPSKRRRTGGLAT
ncbi:hypothetical protein BDZ97DRAFT_1760783 [Flammula alnicola]|nr:hypothetical protein BDZ97DRAFT_1760783 [Flammula alnicola]